MDDNVKACAVRLIEALGHTVDVDYFGDEDAWSFIAELGKYREQGQKLSQAVVAILTDLGNSLGLKPGAPHSGFYVAMEREFGPCPYERATVDETIGWLRSEVNGIFEQGKVDKRGSMLFSEFSPIPPGGRGKGFF